MKTTGGAFLNGKAVAAVEIKIFRLI